MKQEFLSTGFATLDRLLGGGWPRGRVVIVKGLSGVGKSSLVESTFDALDPALGVALGIDEPLPHVHARLERLSPGHDKLSVQFDFSAPDLRRLRPRLFVLDRDLGTASAIGVRSRVQKELERAVTMQHALVIVLPSFKTSGLTVGGRPLEHLVDVVLDVEPSTMVGKAIQGLPFRVTSRKNRFATLGWAMFGWCNGKIVELRDVQTSSIWHARGAI